MKYVCTLCGYIYNEEIESIPFNELPDTYVCPLCQAGKDVFKIIEE